MTHKELREQIGVAFVKAGLPTRQTAISDIMQLVNQHVKEIIGKDEYIDEYSEREALERNNLRVEQRKEAGL